jgi:hypothetical protein
LDENYYEEGKAWLILIQFTFPVIKEKIVVAERLIGFLCKMHEHAVVKKIPSMTNVTNPVASERPAKSFFNYYYFTLTYYCS